MLPLRECGADFVGSKCAKTQIKSRRNESRNYDRDRARFARLVLVLDNALFSYNVRYRVGRLPDCLDISEENAR